MTPDVKTTVIDRDELRQVMKDMFYSYLRQFKRSWVKIELSDADVKAARDFTEKKCRAKLKEDVYQKDGENLLTRGYTGSYAEFALQAYLRTLIGLPDFVDTRIGLSKDFDVPDIPAINMGIKAVEWNKLPVVPIKGRNKYPQIICIVDKKDPDKPVVYICGIADVDTLDEHQSEDYVLDDNLRARHVKAGFYGFEHLRHIDTLKGESPLQITLTTTKVR